jgi:hypothetical protein
VAQIMLSLRVLQSLLNELSKQIWRGTIFAGPESMALESAAAAGAAAAKSSCRSPMQHPASGWWGVQRGSRAPRPGREMGWGASLAGRASAAHALPCADLLLNELGVGRRLGAAVGELTLPRGSLLLLALGV